MVVKLSLLDKKSAVHYTKIVDVYKFEERYEYIGSCEIFRDENGNHLGKLDLKETVSEDFYFYYRARFNDAEIFHFVGLDFTREEDEKSRTTKLKDMIVE